MAEHLATRVVKNVAFAGLLFGFGAWGLSTFTETSVLSLFSGLQKSNEVSPIEDDTGEMRADGYIGEQAATLDRAGRNVAARIETAQDSPAQTSDSVADSEIQSTAPVLEATNFDDPLLAILSAESGPAPQQNDPAASVRQPLDVSPEFEAMLERQRREDEWRAERARQAAVAPLTQSRYTVAELRERQREIRQRRQDEDATRSRASQDAQAAQEQSIVPTGHVLAAGTVISATLIDNLDSELPGLVRAWVSNDVWDSDTMRTVVIPRGSQLLGEYSSISAAGQRRLELTWTRVRLPDGRNVDLDSALGLDESGRVGIEGQRRNGFLTAVFQTALLNMAGSIGNSSSSSDAATLAQAAQMAMGQGVSQVGTQYINDRLTRGTVFRVNAGERINVQITRDFLFPDAYQRQGFFQERNGATRSQIVPASLEAGNAGYVPYDRALYGDWADLDGDCRNTRHEMLQMLSTGNTQLTSDGCAVASGRWIDPYTGQIFTRASELDIDHLVPLAWAHARGGYGWDGAMRAKFANDPVNLFAVDATTNRAKGARGPNEWLPPDASFHCQYILRFDRVVQTYDLTYEADEGAAIDALRVRSCGA